MTFLPPDGDIRPEAYRRFGEMLQQGANWEESLHQRPSFGLRFLGLWFETLAETFWPKAHYRRALAHLQAIRATPDYQDLQQTLNGFPDLVLTDCPAAEGEWRLAHVAYVDAHRRPVPPDRRREERATHFVAYLQTRFDPWVVMLEKELRRGEWRLKRTGTGPWRREVPELLWFPPED